MDNNFRDVFLHAIRATGRSVREVATSAGVSYDLLKSLHQGKARRTNVDDALRVIAAFGVSVDDFYAGNLDGTRPEVAVAGFVGAGAQVQLSDPFAKGIGLYSVRKPQQLKSLSVVAVEVTGNSMVPMYMPGDVLFYTRSTDEGILVEDIGRPCIVADQAGMAWVKQVRRGSTPGLFNLVSLNPDSETVWNHEIKWAARVLMALPQELSDRV